MHAQNHVWKLPLSYNPANGDAASGIAQMYWIPQFRNLGTKGLPISVWFCDTCKKHDYVKGAQTD
jgi:hypothetical protein